MTETYHVRSPGRVNLVGGHTDYSGGYVMPVATDLQTELTAEPTETVTVTSAALDDTATFDPADFEPAGDWSDYVRGCYAVLQDAGYDPGGFEGTIDGDLPIGAGLSSSASLELAVLTFLAAAYDIDVSRKELARLGQRVENEYVGVDCGILDQFAVALSKAGHALFVDTDTEAIDRVALPEELALIVFDTGVAHDLAQTPYGQRRETVRAALEELGAATSKDVDLAALSSLSGERAERLGYVVRENNRVRQALGAIDRDDIERLGEILTEAHEDLAANFDASTPELDWVVETALDEGAHGARLTGAGWGGSVVVVADAQRAPSLAESLSSAYVEAFPDRDGRSWVIDPSDGVTVDS